MATLTELLPTDKVRVKPELVPELRQWLLMQAEILQREAVGHARTANGNGGLFSHLQYRQCKSAAAALLRLMEYCDQPFQSFQWHNAEYVVGAYMRHVQKNDDPVTTALGFDDDE